MSKESRMCGEISVRLFFVKCKGTQKVQVMITSNTELSFIEAFKIYAKRWATEVMYKETKQNLSSQTIVMKMWHAFIALLNALATMIKNLHHCDGFSAVFSLFDAISLLISSFSHCSFATQKRCET